ncbi:MAG: gluconate 2-dehydrogenase subunit 3 family protein [Paracoccaceae bacterium]|nr:MAG: gluconate 2-dehydrogenase subunit 3 family protein [Paracoccaceae bacterium]
MTGTRMASRRQVMVAALAAMAALPLATRIAASPSGERAGTLAAFLDTLLPADDLTPAASALGLVQEVEGLAAEVPLFDRLIAYGTAWLDEVAGGDFAALGSDDRDRVAAWMETSDYDEVPGRFFHVMRTTAIELYYAHPEALAGLPVNAAPMPLGYPPPW